MMITAQAAAKGSQEARELMMANHIRNSMREGINHVTIHDYPMTESLRQELIRNGYVVTYTVAHGFDPRNWEESDEIPEYNECGLAYGTWTISWY